MKVKLDSPGTLSAMYNVPESEEMLRNHGGQKKLKE
jgi:hypothetical protein